MSLHQLISVKSVIFHCYQNCGLNCPCFDKITENYDAVRKAVKMDVSQGVLQISKQNLE